MTTKNKVSIVYPPEIEALIRDVEHITQWLDYHFTEEKILPDLNKLNHARMQVQLIRQGLKTFTEKDKDDNKV